MAKKKKAGKEADKAGAAAAAEAKVAEEEAAPAEPPQESIQVRRMRNNIRNAFLLFDKEGEDRVIREEVGTIIRYLGQHPSEQALVEEILPALDSDEPDAYVTLAKFEPRMLQMLQANEFPPEGQDVIVSAFRALDEDSKGYVEADYLKELLTQMGTPFRGTELDSFLNVAKDITTGRIYYEDYASLYANQVDANAEYWRNAKLHAESVLESKLGGQ